MQATSADGELPLTAVGAVNFGLLVWSTGLAPNPLIESIAEVEKDPKTRRCVRLVPLFYASLALCSQV